MGGTAVNSSLIAGDVFFYAQGRIRKIAAKAAYAPRGGQGEDKSPLPRLQKKRQNNNERKGYFDDERTFEENHGKCGISD